MSAEVILMNKNGIAIASDSAVTIGNRTKIYNTANKMYTLSKFSPIGILIYSNSELMGVPMDIIIKQFREYLYDKKYSTLAEYYNEFIEYCKNFFIKNDENKGMEVKYINIQMLRIGNKFVENLRKATVNKVGKKELSNDAELGEFINSEIERILSKKKDFNLIVSKEYIDKIKIKLDTERIIDIIKSPLKVSITEKNINLLKEYLINAAYDLSYFKPENYVGLAVTGYGESDIFPKCITFEIIAIINGNVIFAEKEREYEINDNNPSCIVTLAQTDVMDEFFLGNNLEIINRMNYDFDDMICKESNENIRSKLVELKNVIAANRQSIINSKRQDIYNSLSFIPREEMIYMAEGMINLTSFKRRLIVDNYTETVGGPIDIAFISKGDGFIWIKRKKYFDSEMNYVFSENYFRNKGENEYGKKSVE